MSLPVGQLRKQQRTSQQGQAMVFVLLTLSVVLLSMTFLYKAGRLTSEKMELQNAADASAYSVSLLEARDLNFSSYLNRAKVANEIGIAQFVGLFSWAAQYSSSRSHFRVLSSYISAIPFVGPPLSAGLKVIGNTLGTVGDSLTRIMSKIAPNVFKFMNAVNLGYSISTGAFHVASMYLIMDTLFTSNGILKTNDPNAKLSEAGKLSAVVHLFSYQVLFTKTYNPKGPAKKNDYTTFAALTSDARDRFSKSRGFNFDLVKELGIPPVNFTLDIPIPKPFNLIPGVPDNVTLFKANAKLGIFLNRAGGTELRFKRGTRGSSPVKGNEFSWSAADVTQLALSLEAGFQSAFGFSGGFKLGGNRLRVEPCFNVLGLFRKCVGATVPFPTSVPLTTGGAQASTTTGKLGVADMIPEKFFLTPGTVPGRAYGGAPGGLTGNDASFAENWMGLSTVIPFGVDKNVPFNTLRSSAKIKGYKGLPGYTDTLTTFKDGKVVKPSKFKVFVAPYMLIGVVKEQVDEEGIDIRDGIQPVGKQRLETKPANSQLGAIAKSEVYFIRPTTGLSYFERSDGLTEYDNAFNPYWQARLVDTTDVDRGLMLLLQQKTLWFASINSTLKRLVDDISNVFGAFS